MVEMTAFAPPLPGPHRPVEHLPARRPASIRRTSTITVLRHDGLLGPVVIDGHARDLLTGPDGEAAAITEQHVRADLTYDRKVATLQADPDEPAVATLVGASIASGFRRVALAAVPDHARGSTLLNLLLDDLPVAALVGGYAVGLAAQTDPQIHDLMLSQGPISGTPDLCAGWAEGAGIMTFLRREGIPPVLLGPAAPELVAVDDDPLAWHERGPLTPHAVRRARMLDVWRDDETTYAHSFYCDTYVSAAGDETVIHEYTVDATLDSGGTFTGCEATVRVLPWKECPRAIGSAARIVGTDARDLRDRVRRTFTGTSTCTHLNDQLRSLEDVPALASVLP